MSVACSEPDTVAGTALFGWLPIGLRAVAAVMLLPAGAMKFLNYSGQVAFFGELGVPFAATMVVVVGVLELAAGVAFVLGAAGRTAALVTVAVMLVAMALDGVVPSNAAVLVASVGLLVLGTGNFSLWEPECQLRARLA